MTSKDWLKKNLLRIKELLNKLGVNFVLSWGLVLGAYREKDIIDWDNDVDVGVIVFDEFNKELLLKIANYIRPHCTWLSYECEQPDRLDLPRYGTGITFCFKDNSHPNCIEFCVIKPDKAVYYCPKGYMYFPKHMFTDPDIINFLGEIFFIPSDTEKYLERCYGKDWRVPKKEGYNDDMIWDGKV